jgi:CelD/BcsL family acetyltransferase involved in cellulose biosynthesis
LSLTGCKAATIPVLGRLDRPRVADAAGWRVTTARTLEELERLRPAWEQLSGYHLTADPEHFLTVLEHRPDAVRPHAVLLERHGRPFALALGRIEDTRLPARIGYREVAAPRVRVLILAYGGYLGDASEPTAQRMFDELRAPLARGEADVLRLRLLEVGSPLHRIARSVPFALQRERAASPTAHWQLAIPDSFDELLRSRSASVRRNISRYGKRLVAEYGDRLALEVFRDGSQLERLFRDTDRVADKTYQRALGVGFSDDALSRALIDVAVRRGCFRAYLLYVDRRPIAFWYGSVSKGVLHTGVTGYDPLYRDQRAGTYLLVRMLEDACADPAIDLVDYGFGDAEYKRNFGDRSWQEADVLVYAATLRGLRTNLLRTSVGGAAELARRALRKASAVARVKRAWRDRLRRGHG